MLKTVSGRRKKMSNNKFRVPKAVYYQCVWILKDLDRLRRLEAISKHAGDSDELVFLLTMKR